MDNVLAKNENANTAHWKRAPRDGRLGAIEATEGPVHSEYGTRVK
jgi:hypothetical protein